MNFKNLSIRMALPVLMAISIAGCSKKDNPGGDGGTTPPPAVTLMDIKSLKALSTSASVNAPNYKKIDGVVVSDASNKNIAPTQVIIQDAQAAIVLNFSTAPSVNVGDEISVEISGKPLVQSNGEIVLNNLDPGKIVKSSGLIVTPHTTTLADVITNATAWDGTLVTVPAGFFTGGGGKYTGTLTYADNTTSVKSQILTGAAFENTVYPAAVNTLTGIVRVNGSDVRIDMRGAADAPSKEGFFLTEDFSGATATYYRTNDAAPKANFLTTYQNTYPNVLNTTVAQRYSGLSGRIWGTAGTSITKVVSISGSSADAGFCSTGRTYLTMLPIDASSIQDTTYSGGQFFLPVHNAGVLKGATSVTIIAAGSKMTIADYQDLITAGTITSMQWNNFNGATDEFKIAFAESKGFNETQSAKFNDQGVWHTIVIPNSKFVNDLNQPNAVFRPTAGKYTRGTIVADGKTLNFGTPIIIDKIIIEYAQKPTWAN